MKHTIMRWKPIVVGVDGSVESARAAVLGSRLAQAAGTSCHLVCAAQESEGASASLIGQHLPRQLLDSLEIRIGRTVTVLQAEAERLGAGLVILGGKRHPALDRWLGGSTAHDVVRNLPVPVLVTKGSPVSFHRVIVGVDGSYAAEPAMREAERFVALLDGQLRAVHVLQPETVLPKVAQLVDPRPYDMTVPQTIEQDVWPFLHVPGAQPAVRWGDPAATLAAEAEDWQADLLVVGSHRKGWVDRLLLGTVSERLLNQLPVSLLDVPARIPHPAHQRN